MKSELRGMGQQRHSSRTSTVDAAAFAALAAAPSERDSIVALGARSTPAGAGGATGRTVLVVQMTTKKKRK